MYVIIQYYSGFDIFNEYSFSVLFFNIFIYIMIMLNIFYIFFLFETKWLKSLNELKLTYNLQMITTFVILTFLSFAGIPPLAGFLSKFLIFIHIFFKSNIIIFLFFLFINLFTIYFYIQNLRFIISKQISNIFIFKNFLAYLNRSSLFSTNFLNFFNVTSIFYFEELFLYFNLISSTLFIN